LIPPRIGKGVILGENIKFGKDVVIWNYVVIGDNTVIGDRTSVGSFCDIGKNVIIGKNCNIQAHVTISNGCKIGDNVFIGPGTNILNDKFPPSNLLTPPTIKNDTIIGGGAVILPNVTINEKAVVAAGSIVTADVPEGIVVKGNPAKKIMTREDYEKRKKAFIKGIREKSIY